MSSNNNDNAYYPSWFNKMSLIEQHKEYNLYRYINLDIYTTPDNKFFNATKLMKLLCVKVREDGKKSYSHSVSAMMRSKRWSNIKDKHPELFNEVKGRGTGNYKGMYMKWILFSSFIGYASASADINFELGEPINEDNSGYIYCCIPESCFDDGDVVKFGRTWKWSQRVKEYGSDTELIYLIPVDDMYLEEEKMLHYMKSFLTQDKKHGDEYFKVLDYKEEDKAFDYFENIMRKYNVENKVSEWEEAKNKLNEI